MTLGDIGRERVSPSWVRSTRWEERVEGAESNGAPAAGPPAEATDGGPSSVVTARAALLQRAVERWKRQLVDLGGRNTLLYYRDLRLGTLDLTDADPVALDGLLGGRTVTLGRLVREADQLPGAARRARALHAKSEENYEERGLTTLFLAWGMATWTNNRGTATPAAPLLLGELKLEPRGGVAEDFEITLVGEWDVNPTLLRLLEADHRVVLDGDRLDELAATDGLEAARMAIDAAAGTAVPGWSTTHRLVVGNFSYAKLPLVRDLDLALEQGDLEAHDLLCAVAGDAEARASVRERQPQVDIAEPDRTPPADEFLVLDADASQSFVVNAVVKGGDLVVEGPPGTGKSQTIANLIASLAARGRRILFVAEKRAAIDAVLERLHTEGLGDIVLDLHGGAGSRRALAQELAKALEAATSIPKPDMRDLHDRLVRRREELRRHAEAVHAKRMPWEVSLYDAQAVVLGTPADRRADVRLAGTALAAVDAAAYRQARVDIERFAVLGGFALQAGRGPWAAAFQAGTVSTPDQARQALAAASQVASTTLPNTVGWIDYVVGFCGLRRPASMGAWADTLALLDGVHRTLGRFSPAIFTTEAGAPLPELAAALAPGARSGFGGAMSRLFGGSVRRARKQLSALWLDGKPKVPDLHAAVLDAAAQQQAWAAISADGGVPRLPDQLTGAAGAYEQFNTELRAVGAWAATGGLESRPAEDLGSHLSALVADSATLYKLPELHAIRQRLAAMGLSPLLAELAARQLDPDQAVAALDFAWHQSIVEHLSISDPVVAGFDGRAHTRALDDFRAADRAHVKTGAVRVRRAVAEHTIAALDANPDAAAVLQREAKKKQRHLPVRELFHQTADVLTALKPCWAMSPLVVAQLLPVERCFDVVVFDEASQVTPADAVGALLRADRAVVAGDTRQLPPTAFFASQTEHDDSDEEPVEGAELSLVEDMESVLDVMGALLGPPVGTRTLGWHYRSRDERLIAFSNAQPSLYNWSLTTFPGVTGGRCPEHVLVPERTGADDGESSAAEVRTVVELILEHATERPEQSLGVITMGIKHAERIGEALRLVRGDHPDLDAFFDHGPAEKGNPEPVFVKNLERVQGDERDAIILSIGYGKSPDGRMQYRFGPLNQEGGERRLNVAITRARQRMTVVSSFSSKDMDPNRLRAEGAQMLHRYLAYAESGGEDLGRVGRTEVPLNAFERDVEAHLTAAGIPLCPQYGASGYRIDFAAQHPTRPGEMVLAIECDGVTYHSSATARDRDRLRQDHLERLGWRFHRIWSTDWFRHRERETERAKAAYDAAVADADLKRARRAAPAARPNPMPTEPSPAANPARGPRPRVASGLPITEYSQAELVALARWIESDTLLRTEDQLLTALMAELGFRKRGSRIVAALTDAIGVARGPST